MRVDFACTASLLGIPPVSLTDIKKRGRQLFYERGGREVRIERIYNRVIFDELLRRSDLDLPFSFQEELDVVWVGHPNWYFRISKHSLQLLKNTHTARAFFADHFSAAESTVDFVMKHFYFILGYVIDVD